MKAYWEEKRWKLELFNNWIGEGDQGLFQFLVFHLTVWNYGVQFAFAILGLGFNFVFDSKQVKPVEGPDELYD